MKKILLISLIFLSSFGFSQMTGPDDVAGTLITAAVRPNSQLDNMATAYTNEVRGGLHNYKRWSQLDSINSARLVQWMLATVADSVGKIYQYDGSAWDELEIGGGDISTGLEKITEDGNEGWVFVDDIRANKGPIGPLAVDLSYSISSSETYGATGESSLATGFETTASGNLATAMGESSEASGYAALSGGQGCKAAGETSLTWGSSNETTADDSQAFGHGTLAQNQGQMSLGLYNVGTSSVNIFEIGIGTGSSVKKNALEVQLDGRILAPEQTIASTTQARQLTTKEYVDQIEGFVDAPSDGDIYARRNETWEALAEETVNNYFCTSWAEVKTAVTASNASNGGNIYMSGDIILTDTAWWDLTGVSFYGTSNWRVLNTDTASIGSQAFEIVVTAGSPRFYNIQFVGSGNGSDAQTFSTFSSRDLFVLKGNQNIDFINCKFTDIIGGDGDVDIIEFENISLNHSATATFNGCTFTSHNNGTNHQMEYNGFKISANNAGTFYVNVYNQTLGKDYPGLNNSGAKFNVDVTTPTLFQYYSDGSAYGITDITSSTSSNIITGARNQAIPSLSDKMLISFAADGQVYEITLQQLKTLLGI